MPVLEYKLLSLGAKNSTVNSFKILVDNSLGLLEDNSNDTNVGSALPKRHVAELDQELYDKATSIPEASTVSFKLLEDDSKYQYGKFKGGNVYKSYDGDIDSSNKNAKSSLGWIILDRSSDKYCLFVNYNGDTSYIIAITDFEPQAIIEDFTPLYDKLKQLAYAKDESFKDDTHITFSLATTFKEDVSTRVSELGPDCSYEDSDKWPKGEISLNDMLYTLWKVYMEAYMAVGEFSLILKMIKDPDSFLSKSYSRKNEFERSKQFESKSYNLFPNQIGFDSKNYNPIANSNSYNEVQAIIYDLPPDGSPKGGIDSSMNAVMCFQQPESISYTSAAQYETVSPRGSQIPFQLYQNANQIDLSFTLKWHIDEVRTFGEDMTLQKIADMSEDFSRPWDNDNGSITPKVCGVILPGIAEIGYISNVQINYTGSMSGDILHGSGSGVQQGNNYKGTIYNTDTGTFEESNASYHMTTTDYYYSELEVTFNLIVVKDVKLHKYNNSNRTTVGVGDGWGASLVEVQPPDHTWHGGGELTDNTNIFQSIQNGAADVISATLGLAEAVTNAAEAGKDLAKLIADVDSVSSISEFNRASSYGSGIKDTFTTF